MNMTKRFQGKRGAGSPRFAWLLWIAIGLLLVIPAHLGLADTDRSLIWHNLLATTGFIILLAASSSLARRWRRAWTGVAVAVLLVSLFVRMLSFGLVRFSGHDFGADFFLHLGTQSIAIAWEQYRHLFALLGFSVVALIAVFAFASRRSWTPPPQAAAALALVGALLLVAGHDGLPEWRLAQATVEWYGPRQLDLPQARMAAWQSSPLLTTDLVTKQQLSASAAAPKNLILLYIESGGFAMAPAQRHPDVAPNLQRLIAEHSLVDYLHASSYVTIEGIVNTLCGTLFPFESSAESSAGVDRMLEQLPCLGDVLTAAGYQQTFLGGADKEFAGKGPFLEAHGYDRVFGSSEWSGQGISQRADTWGVSDVDLFDQSLLELERLKQDGRPFNLTLLTIGTHLPGFSYEECTPYKDGGERFLDAMHCTDQLIGQWVQRLEEKGWLDAQTVLVITGDHQVFPNAEMKRLFGEDAVMDRRLPFIVMGGDIPEARASHGAGYDIAPTVLDLLGVQSNARFALGRSLLRGERELDYFPARYTDILEGKAYNPSAEYPCPDDGKSRIPGRQPLSRCEREELFNILRAQAATYSAPLAQMRCDHPNPVQIFLPAAAADAPLQVTVSGREQGDRFTWRGRRVDPDKPGLYVLAMDGTGTVQSRNFFPAGFLESLSVGKLMKPGTDTAMLLMMWRPDPALPTLPDWLHRLGIGDDGGGWLFRIEGDASPQLVEQAPLGTVFTIAPQQCRKLLAGIPSLSSH